MAIKKEARFLSNLFVLHVGARDWTRTSTPLRAQEPESCVSTNSTTRASEEVSYHPKFNIASIKTKFDLLSVRLDFGTGNDYLRTTGLIVSMYIIGFSGAKMPRFSGSKPFTHELFSRHVDKIRTLLHALELRDSFEDNDTQPKMDMYETCRDIIIEFDLPGFTLDSISLRMNGTTLILEACKPREANEGKFICVERIHGCFHHAVHIPGNFDPTAVKAEYRRGVLRVICPKSAELQVPIKEI